MADPVPGVTLPPSPEDRRRETRESLVAFVITGLTGIVLLLVLVATMQFYFAVQEAIRYWVADPYVPFVNGAFFLAVIVIGIFLVVRLVRRGS